MQRFYQAAMRPSLERRTEIHRQLGPFAQTIMVTTIIGTLKNIPTFKNIPSRNRSVPLWAEAVSTIAHRSSVTHHYASDSNSTIIVL
jgi:hypothetical protein